MMVKGVMIVLVIKGVIIMRSNSDLKFCFSNWVIHVLMKCYGILK